MGWEELLSGEINGVPGWRILKFFLLIQIPVYLLHSYLMNLEFVIVEINMEIPFRAELILFFNLIGFIILTAIISVVFFVLKNLYYKKHMKS